MELIKNIDTTWLNTITIAFYLKKFLHLNYGVTELKDATRSTIFCYYNKLIIGIGNHLTSPDRYLIISRFDDGEIDDSIAIQTNKSTMEVANAINYLLVEKNALTVEIKADIEHLVGEQ